MKTYIERCAIKGLDGKVYTLPSPFRHCHIIEKFYENLSREPEDQGFLTNEGKFVDRFEALKIVQKNHQLLKDDQIRANRLFSENLW